MTHPLHRLAPFTLRMFAMLAVTDPRSPLTEAQREAVRACLKDRGWRVDAAGSVPMATWEAWYGMLWEAWKRDVHSGDAYGDGIGADQPLHTIDTTPIKG